MGSPKKIVRAAFDPLGAAHHEFKTGQKDKRRKLKGRNFLDELEPEERDPADTTGLEASQQRRQDRRRAAAGRLGNVATSSLGVGSSPRIGTATLLGG